MVDSFVCFKCGEVTSELLCLCYTQIRSERGLLRRKPTGLNVAFGSDLFGECSAAGDGSCVEVASLDGVGTCVERCFGGSGHLIASDYLTFDLVVIMVFSWMSNGRADEASCCYGGSDFGNVNHGLRLRYWNVEVARKDREEEMRV